MEEQFPKIYLYRRVVQAKLFIDEHFADLINLDDTAGEAAFSKFHFIRLFKSIYGKTPHQYLICVRIEKARLLLQQGVTVTEACFAVGFDSLGSFSLLFKKLMGQSPQVYRQQELDREEAIKQRPLSFVPGCFAEKKGWVENSNFQ